MSVSSLISHRNEMQLGIGVHIKIVGVGAKHSSAYIMPRHRRRRKRLPAVHTLAERPLVGEDLVHSRIADVLARAREFMDIAQLSVCLATGDTLLAASALPCARVDQFRESVIRALVSRHERWAHVTNAPSLLIRAMVHICYMNREEVATWAASIDRGRQPNAGSVVQSEVLQMGRWPHANGAVGVLASASALAGMTKKFVLIPVPKAPGLYSVINPPRRRHH